MSKNTFTLKQDDTKLFTESVTHDPFAIEGTSQDNLVKIINDKKLYGKDYEAIELYDDIIICKKNANLSKLKDDDTKGKIHFQNNKITSYTAKDEMIAKNIQSPLIDLYNENHETVKNILNSESKNNEKEKSTKREFDGIRAVSTTISLGGIALLVGAAIVAAFTGAGAIPLLPGIITAISVGGVGAAAGLGFGAFSGAKSVGEGINTAIGNKDLPKDQQRSVLTSILTPTQTRFQDKEMKKMEQKEVNKDGQGL